MEKRLGCLSTSGLLVAAFTLVAVVAAAFSTGGAIFSPGELNAQTGDQPLGGVYSHSELSNQCAACHVAPWQGISMDDRCLECHTGVSAQLNDPGTLHGSLMEGGKMTCRECHSEHNGPGAPLTTMSPTDFPHEVVGFSLQAHTSRANALPFTCEDCHRENLTRFDPAVCADCHQQLDPIFMQFHTAAFGAACLDCHDGIDTYGADFDHNQYFVLEGAHATGACGGCHQGARSIAEFRQTPQECYACHAGQDAHNGQFGENCSICHSTVAWEPADFDHARTAFPLVGEHVTVVCSDCHQDGIYAGTPTECVACHAQDDAHDGQFGNDCEACHTPVDWADAVFDHSLSAFPLTGAHVSVACEQCHVDGIFEGTPQTCVSCHQDPDYHLGLFGDDCAACHTTTAWSPATYNQMHTFPINHGESGNSACAVCHPQSLSAYTCYNCHEHDPADIEREHREEGITDFNNCVECHPTGEEGDDD